MCKFSIQIDDKLMEELRPSIATGMNEDVWVQMQVVALFQQMAAVRRQAVVDNARQAISAMRTQSERNGNSRLTLDDINSEIQQTRAARRQ